MQTHKNPSLRESNKAVVPDLKQGLKSAKAAEDVKKPPRLELEGKKYVVEYFK